MLEVCTPQPIAITQFLIFKLLMSTVDMSKKNASLMSMSTVDMSKKTHMFFAFYINPSFVIMTEKPSLFYIKKHSYSAGKKYAKRHIKSTPYF